jgi:hypothetical protein
MNFKIMSEKYEKVVGYDSMLKAVKDHDIFTIGQEKDGTFCVMDAECYSPLHLDSRQLRALGEEIILLSEKTSENS